MILSLFPSRTIFLTLGNFSVYWYGLLYVISFIIALFLLPRLQHFRQLKLTFQPWLNIIAITAAGVLIGGRIGYVLFYDLAVFIANPLQVFFLWQGGMASHGGFIGAGLALWLASRLEKVNIWKLLDLVTVPVAIGLLLGRLGNIINQELFPTLAAQMAVVLKNIIIASACYWHLTTSQLKKPGQTIALFLILYGVLRFLIEFMRLQDFSGFLALTRGQLLTLPIILIGVLLLVWPQLLPRK